jgi:hypothetical protein
MYSTQSDNAGIRRAFPAFGGKPLTSRKGAVMKNLDYA